MNLIKKVLILLVCLSAQSKVITAAAAAAVPAKVASIAQAAIMAAVRATGANATIEAGAMVNATDEIKKSHEKNISDLKIEIIRIPGFEAILKAEGINIDDVLKNINTVFIKTLNINLLQYVIIMCFKESNFARVIKLLLEIGANPHTVIPNNPETQKAFREYIGFNILDIAQKIAQTNPSYNFVLRIIEDFFYTKCATCCSIEKKSTHCAGCKTIQYCSPECQIKHWPEHQRRCRLFRIIQNNQNSISESADEFIEYVIRYLSKPLEQQTTVEDYDERYIEGFIKAKDSFKKEFIAYLKQHSIPNAEIVGEEQDKFINTYKKLFNILLEKIKHRIQQVLSRTAIKEPKKSKKPKKRASGSKATPTTGTKQAITSFPEIELEKDDQVVLEETFLEDIIDQSHASAPEPKSATLAEDDKGGWTVVGKKEKCKGPAIAIPVKLASRHSTQRGTVDAMGRHAIYIARCNPGLGTILDIELNDPNWPSYLGWKKMTQGVWLAGKRYEVHYVFNTHETTYDDFKIVRVS